jgi:hypothetical protein
MRCTRVSRMLAVDVDFEGFFSVIFCLEISWSVVDVVYTVLIYISYNLFSPIIYILLLLARSNYFSFFQSCSDW